MVVAKISATLSILWRRRPLQRWPPADAWGRTAAFPSSGQARSRRMGARKARFATVSCWGRVSRRGLTGFHNKASCDKPESVAQRVDGRREGTHLFVPGTGEGDEP